MYVWRSSGSFDEYANVVPVMENAEELIVRSASPGGARAVSMGGMTVRLELQAAGPDGAWGQVWSSQLGVQVRTRWTGSTFVSSAKTLLACGWAQNHSGTRASRAGMVPCSISVELSAPVQ